MACCKVETHQVTDNFTSYTLMVWYWLRHGCLSWDVSWNVLLLHLPRSQTVPLVSECLHSRQLAGHATNRTHTWINNRHDDDVPPNFYSEFNQSNSNRLHYHIKL